MNPEKIYDRSALPTETFSKESKKRRKKYWDNRGRGSGRLASLIWKGIGQKRIVGYRAMELGERGFKKKS